MRSRHSGLVTLSRWSMTRVSGAAERSSTASSRVSRAGEGMCEARSAKTSGSSPSSRSSAAAR